MNNFRVQNIINCQGKIIDLSIPKVMGIVNITPDSFYEGSRATTQKNILDKVNEMVEQGVDIVDFGAYSSRPGAENITELEEWERLNSALDSIRTIYPELLISIDTFRSGIVQRCIEQYKVNLINDISAGELDQEMFDVIGQYKIPYVLMHMKGTPQNMQVNPSYTHIVNELIAFFVKKRDDLLSKGAMDVIIDPGFGFGKNVDHNYELMARLNEFQILESPLLVGVSRKSLIYRYLNTKPHEALNGTTVLNTLALTKGANILRVHDVQEAVEIVKLFAKVNESAN